MRLKKTRFCHKSCIILLLLGTEPWSETSSFTYRTNQAMKWDMKQTSSFTCHINQAIRNMIIRQKRSLSTGRTVPWNNQPQTTVTRAVVSFIVRFYSVNRRISRHALSMQWLSIPSSEFQQSFSFFWYFISSKRSGGIMLKIGIKPSRGTTDALFL